MLHIQQCGVNKSNLLIPMHSGSCNFFTTLCVVLAMLSHFALYIHFSVEKPLLDMGWERIEDNRDLSYHLKWVECKSQIDYKNFKEGEIAWFAIFMGRSLIYCIQTFFLCMVDNEKDHRPSLIK